MDIFRSKIWKTVIVFLFFFLLLGIANQVNEYWSQSNIFCRAKDGNYYQVRNLRDNRKAVDLLSRMNRRIKVFLRYLRKKHPTGLLFLPATGAPMPAPILPEFPGCNIRRMPVSSGQCARHACQRISSGIRSGKARR